jgi:hypothetical protein
MGIQVMEIISLMKTCAWSAENLKEMVSYGTDTYGDNFGRIHTARVRLQLRATLAICVQRQRERERERDGSIRCKTQLQDPE